MLRRMCQAPRIPPHLHAHLAGGAGVAVVLITSGRPPIARGLSRSCSACVSSRTAHLATAVCRERRGEVEAARPPNAVATAAHHEMAVGAVAAGVDMMTAIPIPARQAKNGTAGHAWYDWRRRSVLTLLLARTSRSVVTWALKTRTPRDHRWTNSNLVVA